MNDRKKTQRNVIRERAADAVRNLYHNATPQYPRNVPDNRADFFQSWFDDSATFEIEYISDGGAYGNNYEKTLRANCNAGKYTSAKAREFYVKTQMRKMRMERARCNSLDSREHATSAQWERITEFGKLYTWGRGGRTLAPNDLIKTHGGSSFSVNESAFDEASIADCVDAILILESFNRHVKSWCDNVPEMWREYFAETLSSERIERKQARNAAKKIANEKRNARDAFANIAQF